MSCKAVIFDYIGTLVNCNGYTMEASRDNLHRALFAEGFTVSKEKFLEAYIEAHEKYRKVRFEELREVTNSVWVAEALNDLGFQVDYNDYRINCALNVFFKDYIDTFELRIGAKKLIKKAKRTCRIGLISNFTFAPVIYSSLRILGINSLFDTVIVSQENGWRKPSTKIFNAALNKLGVEAQNAVYIGDSPLEDIKGANESGIGTIFLASQFYSFEDLRKSQQLPNYSAKDLTEVSNYLTKFL